MIKVKGRDVTLTGKDAEAIQNLANNLGISPQKAFNKCLRTLITNEKKKRKVKK